MIEWTHEMSTGIAEIDMQHKELIKRFNLLSDALNEGRGREETGKLLNFVQFYTDWHFGREERCMEEYGCPIAEHNRDQHSWFLEEFTRLYDHYYAEDTDPDVIVKTFASLERWIVDHIMRTDGELRSCVPKAQQSTG